MRQLIVQIALVTFIVACSKARDTSTAGDGADSATATSVSKSGANAEVTERMADSVQSVGVPTAVAEVGTHGEDLYDQAKASNWAKATVILDSLHQSAAALTASERAQMSGVLDTLRKAIANHQREAALEASNRVTFLGAQLSEAYHPKMPADIVRLDYYGRELEIWAAQKNVTKLAATAADLRQSWERVKPTEISHGGAAAAARTDSLVARLAAAKTAADYAKIATPILDVVDELEKPFEK